MPFNRGKFNSTQSMHHNPSAGEKVPAKSTSQEDGKAPHGQAGNTPEHVTKTHPGETQPHPETGVHAVHIHHVGGGKHMTHTHHDGGEVETQHHESADEAHQVAHQSLPGGEHMGDDDNMPMGGESFKESLGGIGGESSYD